MDPIRSIIVHVDGSPRSAVRLRLAHALGAEHEAEVCAVLAVTPSFVDLPLAYTAGDAAAELLQQMDAERRQRARASFERESAQPGGAMRWSELPYELTTGGFIERALFADLLVLGQHDASDKLAYGVPPDFVQSVLIGSGRPALVVPYAGEFASIGRDVLIAWKPTREAARAVASALPLLRRARQVHVITGTEDAAAVAPAATLADLASYLRCHGVTAQVEPHRDLSRHAGEAVLSLAADVGADLLVMGCYGHTRTRELLLGGVTRTVLQSMTLPVLMAH